MRGGSVGVRACVPEPAGGVVQSGNGGAETDSFRLALAQRLEGWKGVFSQYRYTIKHIPGDRNAWGDLLSCWVSVPALPVRAVAVFGPCDQDDSLPSKAVVRQAPQKALGRMARRCNLMSRPLALLSWTMRVCFAFMRVVDMFCGLRILTSSCRCCLLYTSPSPRDLSTSRMPSSA